MIELDLDRRYPKADYTIGELRVNGRKFSSTLEDTDRGLVSDMPLADIAVRKKYGMTAIPKGRYRVVMSVSAKFSTRTWARPAKGLIPEILGVPGFSGVRIHPGNTAEDTLGCILVGLNKVRGGLVESTKYYQSLVDKYLLPAWKKGEEIYITVR